MDDDNIKVEETTKSLESTLYPSHKITITQGSDKYVYWYVKSQAAQEDFDKSKDSKLVRIMHAKGMEMNIGYFESFNLDRAKDYHLERRDSHEFIIKRLK